VITPGRGTTARFGKALRAPWMIDGTTGTPARAAVANAPVWKRLSPGSVANVPSGKNTSE